MYTHRIGCRSTHTYLSYKEQQFRFAIHSRQTISEVASRSGRTELRFYLLSGDDLVPLPLVSRLQFLFLSLSLSLYLSPSLSFSIHRDVSFCLATSYFISKVCRLCHILARKPLPRLALHWMELAIPLFPIHEFLSASPPRRRHHHRRHRGFLREMTSPCSPFRSSSHPFQLKLYRARSHSTIIEIIDSKSHTRKERGFAERSKILAEYTNQKSNFVGLSK